MAYRFRLRAAAVALACFIVPGVAQAHRLETAGPLRARTLDDERALDAGAMVLWIGNDGLFGLHRQRSSSGLIYPGASGRTAMFGAGPWLSGVVNGEHRLALVYYASEFGPGPILPGGAPANPDLPAHRVFKVVPWRGNPADTGRVALPADPPHDPWVDELGHHAWSEYLRDAAPHGAPVRTWRLPVTHTADPADSVDVPGPDVIGDQMTWAVWNDADPARHDLPQGSTAPLGIEVQHTSWTSAGPGPLAHVVFMRYRLIHKGTAPVTDFHFSMWSDVDLGVGTDDRTAVDAAHGLGFVYQQHPRDAVYGATAPAVGFQLLQGPIAAGDTLGITAFQSYRKAIEDVGLVRPVPMARGLRYDSTAFVNPHTGQPTSFQFDGDVLAATGWLDDELRADRRILVSTGPFVMSPGDTQDVVLALVVGQGEDPIGSVGSLRCRARDARLAYESDFGRRAPMPAPQVCESAFPCPRDAAFWAAECALRSLPPGELDSIATQVDSASVALEWGTAKRAGLCDALSPPGPQDARERALRAFVAAKATLAATRRGTTTNPNAASVLLHPFVDAGCVGAPQATVGERLAPNQPSISAVYVNGGAHPRALNGVDLGLGGFGGGADFGWNFLSSSLYPPLDPDGFPTVEVTFLPPVARFAHRWLRLELADGSPPPLFRWRYGGYRLVNFAARDSATGALLATGFVERLKVDAAGVPLPAAQQPATLDSTWAPDTSATGGHEYLLVFDRPYSPAPDPLLASDAALTASSAPLLYGLAARLRSLSDPIDPEDRFLFRHSLGFDAGVDARLLALATASLADPAVVAAYDSISSCLEPLLAAGDSVRCGVAFNRVDEIGREIDFDRVRFRLQVFGASGFAARLERIGASTRRAMVEPLWQVLGVVESDSTGTIVIEDRDVTAGQGYTWRLVASDASGAEFEAAVLSAEVPLPSGVALAGFRPNPANGAVAVSFVLPAASTARLELHDVAGRRVMNRDLGTLPAGRHLVPLAETESLRAGVYFIRLVAAGRATTARGVLLR